MSILRTRVLRTEDPRFLTTGGVYTEDVLAVFTGPDLAALPPHQSFNYALLDEQETAILGCVDIDPPERARSDGEVSWWVVDDLVGGEAERALAFWCRSGSLPTGRFGSPVVWAVTEGHRVLGPIPGRPEDLPQALTRAHHRRVVKRSVRLPYRPQVQRDAGHRDANGVEEVVKAASS